tara:strand:- start:344 stop:799 length:456 start_codon:yes stop_codon:yes gene_type:complete
MKKPLIVRHAQGAPGLRFLGIGANFKPNKGVEKLSNLLNENTSWASRRSKQDIRAMLRKSVVVVSMWCDNRMIGFGRATTDEIFRAVLWDVVVDKEYQDKGLGKKIVQTILHCPKILKVEKVYVMTTNCREFYSSLGFKIEEKQNLMILKK